MELDRLRRELEHELGAERFAELWEQFTSGSATGDPDLFLGFLQERGLISEARFRALHMLDTLTLGDFDDLVERSLDEGPDAVTREHHRPDLAERYVFLGTLGEGAMGQVCLVRDQRLGRKVAYKRVGPALVDQPRLLSRFAAEVSINAQLDHPHIVPVYELDSGPEGLRGYTMRFIQGRTFRQLVLDARTRREQGLPMVGEHSLAARLEHFLKACDAVAHAHDRGVVHRDLKPLNLMVGQHNEVYVLDWGIARLMDRTPEDPVLLDRTRPELGHLRTELGTAIGTPAYMSPEQAMGMNEELDGRSDLYSLALVLFELVTLQRARSGASRDAVVTQAAEGDPELDRTLPEASAPPEILAIIQRATALRPEERYPDVRAFASDLRAHLRDEPVSALPDTPLRAAQRWLAHHRVATLAALVVLSLATALLALGGATLLEVQRASARQHEEALGRVISQVAVSSRPIDAAFQRHQGLLEALAARAEQQLSLAPQAGFFYTAEAMGRGEGPADLLPSPAYGRPISLEHASIKLAPGVDPDQVAPAVGRLLPLARPIRTLFLRSDSEETALLDPSQATARLRDRELPLAWAYVALEQGVHYSWPGHGGYPDEYDSRQRPWYRDTRGTHGPRWGSPYVDINGLGLLLPCNRALYDQDGAFLGVAGVEITLDWLITTLLVPESLPLTQAWLLDDQGRIVVSSEDAGRFRTAGSLGDESMYLARFPLEEVVAAVQEGRSGHALLGEDLLVYQRMGVLGWTYVVRGDAEELLEAP